MSLEIWNLEYFDEKWLRSADIEDVDNFVEGKFQLSDQSFTLREEGGGEVK